VRRQEGSRCEAGYWQPSRGRIGLLTPSDLGLGTPAECCGATRSIRQTNGLSTNTCHSTYLHAPAAWRFDAVFASTSNTASVCGVQLRETWDECSNGDGG